MEYIDIKEFVDEGYLQEVNRQFLHPLGLALSVNIDADDNYTIGPVWDCRQDKEGIIFEELGRAGHKKAKNIQKKWDKRYDSRYRRLEYIIQPVR